MDRNEKSYEAGSLVCHRIAPGSTGTFTIRVGAGAARPPIFSSCGRDKEFRWSRGGGRPSIRPSGPTRDEDIQFPSPFYEAFRVKGGSGFQVMSVFPVWRLRVCWHCGRNVLVVESRVLRGSTFYAVGSGSAVPVPRSGLLRAQRSGWWELSEYRRLSAQGEVAHAPPGPVPAGSGRAGRVWAQASLAPDGTSPVSARRHSAISSFRGAR